MKRVSPIVALALVIAASIAPLPSHAASGEAERLFAAGAAAFQDGDNERAIELLDRASKIAPNDADIALQRAIVLGKSGRREEAVDVLEGILADDPDNALAALELGYGLFEAGEHDKAEAYLRTAAADSDLAARATLFIGLTQLRRDMHQAAIASFERARRADESLAVSSAYYSGVARYRLGETDAARRDFDEVQRIDSNSALAREARGFLDKIEQADPRRTRFYVTAGLEYDSNVILDPADDDGVFADSGSVGDGRFALTAGVRHVLAQWSAAQLVLGYEFFQSSHFRLDEFDIQNHRVSADLASRAFGNATFGLSARYDYYFRQLDAFLGEFTALPWLRVDQPGFGHTDTYYRFQLERFEEDPFDVLSDGNNHAFAVRQTFYLDGEDRNAYLGYRFDIEDARNDEGEAFMYDGHQVDVGMSWQLDAVNRVFAQYSFRYEDYDDASGGLGAISGVLQPTREDDRHDFTLGISHHWGENTWLNASYVGTINDSNQEAEGFKYDRHVGQVALEWRY